ncbi:uncharacterized protein LOC135301553 isoform X5 [Passer domesticus]|uniref:uncharacterized protein LOC135301553 isoform X5 n=1 Tax=Passer domesticus TaxID=48849 RepID=UPI0030FF12CA
MECATGPVRRNGRISAFVKLLHTNTHWEGSAAGCIGALELVTGSCDISQVQLLEPQVRSSAQGASRDNLPLQQQLCWPLQLMVEVHVRLKFSSFQWHVKYKYNSRNAGQWEKHHLQMQFWVCYLGISELQRITSLLLNVWQISTLMLVESTSSSGKRIHGLGIWDAKA